MKIHPVFSVLKLRRFIPDPIAGREHPLPPPPVVAQDGVEEYEVDRRAGGDQVSTINLISPTPSPRLLYRQISG